MTEKSKHDSGARLAAGNADAWREFIASEIPKLYAMFLKKLANPSLAEELVQKTIFDAVKGRTSFDSAKGSPQQWVFGIARNNIRLEFRNRASRPSVNGDMSSYLEVIDTELLPDELLEREETAVMVRAAMSELETKERTALKLKYIQELSARQIAKQIGITEKAVHSLLYRARKSLAKKLKRQAAQNNEVHENEN
ncbi:RNA polymerase sigma factor [Planctomycetota bacterium]